MSSFCCKGSPPMIRVSVVVVVQMLLLSHFGTGGRAFLLSPNHHKYGGLGLHHSCPPIIVSSSKRSMTLGESSSTTSNKNSTGEGSSSTTSTDTSCWYAEWAVANGIQLSNKIMIRDPLPEERGKGGVEAIEPIAPLEVLAHIPRSLVISAVDAPHRAMEAAAHAKNFSWATDLTAATLIALHPLDEDDNDGAAVSKTPNQQARQDWITSWREGGWATDPEDLGPPDAKFGPQAVTGSLMATGSDNDHNIFAKFRMPCHPVILRASIGLAVLTGCSEDEAQRALTHRGRWYRSMRDALQELVLTLNPQRTTGSNREKRSWEVADVLSKVLSRVTALQLELDDEHFEDEDQISPIQSPTYAIVPIHERLAHCCQTSDTNDGSSNTNLVSSGDHVLLVATREIAAGHTITRDYIAAPQLENDYENHEDPASALRLLLQFGLPPSAW